MAMTVISEIVSQHAEESAFLWLLRSNAIHQPHYALKDITKLDDRVEAHLDGLRVAGKPGWELCKAALGNEEVGEVFAASVMAFESGIELRIEAVLAADMGSSLDITVFVRVVSSHGSSAPH